MLQLGFWGDQELHKGRPKRQGGNVNECIKRNMPIFRDNYLDWRLARVKDLLTAEITGKINKKRKYKIPALEVVEILDQFNGIKYDIIECFRDRTALEYDQIERKYADNRRNR